MVVRWALIAALVALALAQGGSMVVHLQAPANASISLSCAAYPNVSAAEAMTYLKAMAAKAIVDLKGLSNGVLRASIYVPWNGSYLAINASAVSVLCQGPVALRVSAPPSVGYSMALLNGTYVIRTWFIFWTEALALAVLVLVPAALVALGRLYINRVERGPEGRLRAIGAFGSMVSVVSAPLFPIIFIAVVLLDPLVPLFYQLGLGRLGPNVGLAVDIALLVALSVASFAASYGLLLVPKARALRGLVRPAIEEQEVKRFAYRALVIVLGSAAAAGLLGWWLSTLLARARAPAALQAVLPVAAGLALVMLVSVAVTPRAAGPRGVESPELSSRVAEVWLKAGLRGRAPRVYLVKTLMGMKYNAAARGLLRPSIVVAEPLLSLLSDDELSSVLAHEAAHVAGRHVAKILAAFLALGLGGLVLLVAGLRYPNERWGTIVSAAGLALGMSASLLIRPMARRLESAADVSVLRRAGFDPRAFISAMGKLAAANAQPTSFDRLTGAVATHPGPLARALRVAREFGIDDAEAINIFRTAYNYVMSRRGSAPSP